MTKGFRMKKYYFLCLISAFSLAGCTTQTLNFAPSEVPPLHHPLHAELAVISVSIAKKDESKGPIQLGYASYLVRSSLKDALGNAAAKAMAFTPHADMQVALKVQVMKFQTIGYGRIHDTVLLIHYDLQSVATGKSLFSKDIETTGQVTPAYSFNDATRYNEARNIAVRRNIVQLIDALNSYQKAQEEKAQMPCGT